MNAQHRRLQFVQFETVVLHEPVALFSCTLEVLCH